MSAPSFAQLTHPDFGHPLQWWHYTDNFAVAGFINRDQKRITKQAVHNGTECYWHSPLGPLPIYGAELLAERPDAPVLVLETERAADAARALFPTHVCVTWPGGSNAVNKADTMPFAGRDVVLWPDNDGESWTAMNRLQVRLGRLPRTLVQIAMQPTWPDKWDLTWPLPAGATAETLQRMLQDAMPDVSPPAGSAANGHAQPHPEEPAQPASRRMGNSLDRTLQPLSHRSCGCPPFETAATRPPQGEACALSHLPPQAGEDTSSSPESAGVPPAHERAGGPCSPTNETWPEPDWSLRYARHTDVPAFPAAVLPGSWRPWAEHAARGAGAALDHVALSLLTTAASLIGTARRVAPTPSWAEPCILWTALVGPPSCGKTAAMNTSLDPLRALDDAPTTDDDDQRRRHITALETARAERWWWREGVRTAVANKRAPALIPAAALEPEPFVPRRLIADDAAVDVIADLLCGSTGGVLLPRDADDAWLEAMARGGKGGGDRIFWQSAWSGTRCSISRKRKPALRLDRPAVSILGTLEPQAIAAAMAHGDDGVMARFLFASAQRPPLQALDSLGATGPDAQEALARLRDMPAAQRDVPLASDARAVFDDFRRAHNAHADAQDGLAAAWWAKGPGTVLRLAGVLSFLAWAARPDDTTEPAHVPAWAIEAAAGLWWDYLWPHAHALFRCAGNSEQQRHAGRVLRWLAAQHLHTVSREQIRRTALGQKVNADGADDVIATLIDGRWLRPMDHQPTGPGRPPCRWHVNPALRESLPPEGEGAPIRRFDALRRNVGGRPLDVTFTHEPHPEERAQRASRRVGNHASGETVADLIKRNCSPSFETPATPAPQDEVVRGFPVSAISATDSESKGRRGDPVIPSESGNLSRVTHGASFEKIPRCARDDHGSRQPPAITAISATCPDDGIGTSHVSRPSPAPRS